MGAYGDFASVYDTFMDNVPYEEFADRFERFMEKAGKGPDAFVVDLGCGTGILTEMMADRGHRIMGVDLSEEMLTVAYQRREESGHDTLYVCQDMRELDLGMEADVFVSALDCVNYLLSAEDLTSMFRSVAEHLKDDGIFLFDFNTVHKYRDVIGDTVIAESREDCAFIWENYYDRETKINEYDLTLFMEDADGRFRRSFETHVQRGYTLADMKRAAAAAGLTLYEAEDADDGGAVRAGTERVFAAMRKG